MISSGESNPIDQNQGDQPIDEKTLRKGIEWFLNKFPELKQEKLPETTKNDNIADILEQIIDDKFTTRFSIAPTVQLP